MGVRGLTTFIAHNSNQYLKHYELHDTYLVIDGNNLAMQLYKWHTKCYDCFGGDYDKYERTVLCFFNLLKSSNVTPLIIFDGGYEDKKLKTIFTRVKTRINQARQLNCVTEKSMTVFPLFVRELFVEIVMKLGLKVVRCLVEADYEMACVARKLKCPVLSYDSDFFIFDVDYVPFNSVNINGVRRKPGSAGGYAFIECKIYRVDYFLRSFGGMTRDLLPLFATLLGNDYIKPSTFSNFYNHLKLGRRHGNSDTQRKIKAVIRWLREENFESALRKILGRIKQVDRKDVAKQIMEIADGYVCTDSQLFKYLDIKDVGKGDEKLTAASIDLDSLCEGDTESEESDGDEKMSDEDDVDMAEAEKIMKPEDSRSSSELPKFFEDRYKRCLYPAVFIDILSHNRYILIPQIEDYDNPISSHEISLPVLSAIYKMLSFKNSSKLKYITRNKNARIYAFYLGRSKKDLPTLNELENLTADEALKCFFNVLEIDQRSESTVNDFPPDWRLFIVSVIYWIRNSMPKVSNCHIYAIILTAITLKLDIGHYVRDERKLQQRFSKEMRSLEATRPELIVNNKLTNTEAIGNVTKNDGIMLYKELVANFHMSVNLRSNPKRFDVSIVHAFAQFQSCAFHIKYLNNLLNKPLDDYLISQFYDGTFNYNLTQNFLTRNDLDAYVRIVLRFCPNVYTAFTKVKMSLALVTDNWTTNVVNKRKRKRGSKEKFSVYAKDGHRNNSDDDDDDEGGGNEQHFDKNNRFSLLSVVDK